MPSTTHRAPTTRPSRSPTPAPSLSPLDLEDQEMEKNRGRKTSDLVGSIYAFLRKCLFSVISFGPVPQHIAFIMDGNRRFAKSRSIEQGSGHNAGFTALVSVLQYCYEMGVKYVTVYAFSIDNFKRKPDEVQSLMNLMKEKIDELLREESVVHRYGVRINFWGNLGFLSDQVRSAAEKAMSSTAGNTGPVLSVCVAYTSTDEIVHAVQESALEKSGRVPGALSNGYHEDLVDGDGTCVVSVADIERHLYTGDCPDPDIVIRTSGESRLSNFLLWQAAFSHLQNPTIMWPEFSLRHLVWAVLEYQRVRPYLEERRTNSKRH